MGFGNEFTGLRQGKKHQGQTNDRLDDLIEAQWETNRLLALLYVAIARQPVPPPPPRR